MAAEEFDAEDEGSARSALGARELGHEVPGAGAGEIRRGRPIVLDGGEVLLHAVPEREPARAPHLSGSQASESSSESAISVQSYTSLAS